jgi:hypothetical protein
MTSDNYFEHSRLQKRREDGHGMHYHTNDRALSAAPTVMATSDAGFGRMCDPMHMPGQLATDSGLANLPVNVINSMLAHIGRLGGPMDEGEDSQPIGNSDVPSGYTFLGQFIDHDITFDPISQFSNELTGNGYRNFRTPALDLDSLYLDGPDVSPYLYQKGTGQKGKFLIGESVTNTLERFVDLPRNQENVALIGDPRNDENLIVSQLHLAFLHFHNGMMSQLLGIVPESERFAQARAHVIYYYHKMVVEDFLPHLLDTQVLMSLILRPPHLFVIDPTDEAYMPLEFSVAAYRYGHSQVRGQYRFNDATTGSLFRYGASHASKPTTYLQWKHFFKLDPIVKPELARKIDVRLPSVLLDLPFLHGHDPITSLASRNLMRGRVYNLPSGQTIANYLIQEGLMEATDVSPVSAELSAEGFTETPLWYYVIEEAQKLRDGNRLGPVGGRLVGEVLVGLMKQTPCSYLNDFEPLINLNNALGTFTVREFLHIAFPKPTPDPYPYRVQPYDTLSTIAQRHNVPLAMILRLNPEISDPDVIYVGQIILLPGGTIKHIWPLS